MSAAGGFRRLFSKGIRALRSHDLAYSLKAAAGILLDFARSRFWHAYYSAFKLRRLRELEFAFDGSSYRYFYHPYNTTYRSERAVEVPIAVRLLKANAGKAVLEAGNVLSHYMPVAHEVLDRYETADGIVNLLEGYDPGEARIINRDICDFRPDRRYDLIVSISTIEHVGWDETPRTPGKAGQAIVHLAGLLNSGGNMVITFLLGHNPELDEMVLEGKAGLTRLLFMRRISKDNEWKQVGPGDLAQGTRGRRFAPHANLAVGFIERGESQNTEVAR